MLEIIPPGIEDRNKEGIIGISDIRFYHYGYLTKTVYEGDSPIFLREILGVGTYRPYFLLGNIYCAIGDLDGAFEAYEKSLKLNPKLNDALFKIAEIMAFTADFNTPKTASGRYIIVSGIVPANTAFIEVMQLSVSRFESGVEHFYITKEYENSTSDPVTINETLIIAAVPQITSSDDVTFTSFGSIIGKVDLA